MVKAKCNDENEKGSVTDKFARVRLELKSFEQWKMDDIDHYYVKNYFYFKHPSNTNDNQRKNARELVNYLDGVEENLIQPYSVCDDKQALEDLLFAYLHVGRIRNQTNHAEERAEDSGTLFPDDKDDSSKLITIKESIEYYIQSYDKVSEIVKDKDPNVIRITSGEVKSAARRIDNEEGDGKRSGR